MPYALNLTSENCFQNCLLIADLLLVSCSQFSSGQSSDFFTKPPSSMLCKYHLRIILHFGVVSEKLSGTLLLEIEGEIITSI